MTETEVLSKITIEHPFQKNRKKDSNVTNEETTITDVKRILSIINEDEVKCDGSFEKMIKNSLMTLVSVWREKKTHSEVAFEGLLIVLELCLQNNGQQPVFSTLIEALGYHSVQFWKSAIPIVFNSDLTYGTKYRDALLFNLTLFDVNSGRSKLKELFAADPYLQKSLLGVNAKRFGEQYHSLQRRRSKSSLLQSEESMSELSEDETDIVVKCSKEKQLRRHRSIHITSSSESLDKHDDSGDDNNVNTTFSTGGLTSQYLKKRVINVSNAPPVSLKKEKTGEWEIKQGSGGLVSCVDPVMSKDHENMWLANLGMNINKRNSSCDLTNKGLIVDNPPTTNTLGLPLIRQQLADVLFHVLADDEEVEDVSDKNKGVKDDLSLLGVLNNYNKGNYKLNPVIVQEDDYNVYYGGISNGLIWPAFHNLEEYIVKIYDDPLTLNDHWCAYVRVNYQFAIDAVRNSRPQDFIWIHDYHLMLTGMIMQNLDPNLEVGFFLHIPFQPSDEFFTKYSICSLPVLRGLLKFSKVGFQTHRDRESFIDYIKKYLPTAQIFFDPKTDTHTITHEGTNSSLGVFPVSIKNEDFLKIAKDSRIIEKSLKQREIVMGKNPPKDSNLIFSVERFDYTKGIKEKLLAWMHYFKKYPERIGKDVLLQVAVTNRRSVDTYRIYQDECLEIAEQINGTYKSSEYPNWKPLIFSTDGLPRESLVATYLAMDIGLVTPKKDGMNLVVKEMLVCNPHAGLVLSTGAGSEIQFTNAGLYSNEEQTYKRVVNMFDIDEFADAIYKAAIESKEVRSAHGKKLNEFIMANDIERWSSSFLDPAWSHQVIKLSDIKTLDDFYKLMMRTRDIRRQIVERVLKGIPISDHFSISLINAKDSLLHACKPGTTQIILQTDGEESTPAQLDIATEVKEFERDISFLEFALSDDVYNVELFIDSLQSSHSGGAEQFRMEVSAVADLFYDADHFEYFFTDRDGTLKSYSCTYQGSVQPAYSGVIQAQFARRCAQTCCIVTTSPMLQIGVLDVSTIPEGYYYFGASVGRDWYLDPSNKFRDTTISPDDLHLLDIIFDAISAMLRESKWKRFTWIGSGLQKHYGHITLAHQDVFSTVENEQVLLLDKEIKNIVREHDPSGERIMIKLTETDIKIFLKTSTSGEIFTKGDGLTLFAKKMGFDLSKGHILVCGDSESDIPMLETCLKYNHDNVYTVWVSTNETLKEKVAYLCKIYNNDRYAFVSCPEVLLGGMAQATIREININRSLAH
uniref:alpha,alpha-trehalose-phosphate synthase (UDP-forming) n=1 Tax=Parastrongyloides trichosuri TaxID=131310 RepID=A0A0N4ZCB8_PARTI